MIYLQLIYEFFKVGMFAIGGGLAAIPFLQELSVKTGWFTGADIADMIAVSEATPGAVGINMSTYAGYRVAGSLGAVCSTPGLITPSVIIILLIAQLLRRYREHPVVKEALTTLRPVSLALIVTGAYDILRFAVMNMDAFAVTGHLRNLFELRSILIGLVCGVVWKRFRAKPILFILIAAVLGIMVPAF